MTDEQFQQKSFSVAENHKKEDVMKFFRSLIEKRGIPAVGRRAGINPCHLYTILSDEGNPRLETFLQLAKALNISITLSAS